MKKLLFTLVFTFLCFCFSIGQNTIYFKKGFDFYEKNELDSAFFYFKKDLKFNIKSHDTIKAFDYLYIGKIYKLQQKIPEALQFFNAAEVLFKKHNSFDKLAFLYATIAEFYRAKFDYLSSKKYLKLCEEIINNQKVSKKNTAYFWSRKAALFIEYDEDIEKSLKCSKKVLAIAKEIKDKELEASALNEIGYVYENAKIQLAETYYLQALKIYEQQQKPIYQLDLIINLSRLYNKLGRYPEAKVFIDKGFEIATKNKNENIVKELHDVYYTYYQNVKDFEKAIYHLNLYHEAEKKDLENKWNKNVIDAEKKYELEKNKRELNLKIQNIKVKEEEIKNNKIRATVLTSLLLIAILFSLMIYYFLKKSRRQNKALQLLSDENVFLMAEANHRINNNLQLIIVLINEELKKANAENNVQIKRILSKVDSIATLHKHLYHGNDKKNIDSKKYLTDIQINFLESFKENNIETNFEIQAFPVKVDVAMYFGLLLTELSINSIKHAFGSQVEKTINFSLKKVKNTVQFNYSDNGKGTEHVVVLKLVDKLCRQLKIKYQLDTKNKFLFTFEKEF